LAGPDSSFSDIRLSYLFFADFFDRDFFEPDDFELLFEALLRAGVRFGARDAA
jgi:hypothetical protein